jgi:glycosyltransferase involved in cell wall biosynthesis
VTDAGDKLDFTVAIPTYNGAQRLPAVLEQLRSQVDVDGMRWEILVVDNNSKDETAAVVERYKTKLADCCTVRYLFEARQGAAYARKTAVAQAQSDLIGFLDDDNIPAPNWIAAAVTFAQQHQQAGAFGSHIDAQFEVTPPPEFHRIEPFLAITHLGSEPFLYRRRNRLLPPSAGLVVRKQAWLDSIPQRCFLTGRTRDSMLTGEDLEVLSYLQRHDWEVWHNPAMKIEHQIPRWRLERDYLIPFMQGTGLSRHVTRMLSVEAWQRPFFILAFWMSDLRRLLVHLIRDRQRLKTDLIAACEAQFFWSCLVSPWYVWGKIYLEQRR